MYKIILALSLAFYALDKIIYYLEVLLKIIHSIQQILDRLCIYIELFLKIIHIIQKIFQTLVNTAEPEWFDLLLFISQ